MIYKMVHPKQSICKGRLSDWLKDREIRCQTTNIHELSKGIYTMGMKISVGLQKKVGQPNYGSLGASCHVEFELDMAMIENNLEGFHNKVNSA